MCGIVTIISKNKLYERLFNKLKKKNFHRGPDKIRTLFRSNYKILFRRLSIIDLTNKGNQPYVNEKKTVDLVFNGEIYNYLELREELKLEGISFTSQSDTEVVMKSYEFWGIKFVKKLKGMFSIIIFDNIKKKIIFLRDPLGQKPLYFSFINKDLIVSSEIKDIIFLLKARNKKIKENKKTVFKYLLRGWCNDDANTFFENIFEFPAGTYSTYSNKKLSKPIQYWNLKFKNNNFKPKNFYNEFKNNLNIHLRSDVPIAMTLSGGLDSSSLVKTAIDVGKSKQIKTFSLKLQSTKDDESSQIKKFVKLNKLNHEFINVEKFYSKDILNELIRFQDEPISSPSHINQFILRKQIKKRKFKVLIVGEGGDEILGGYKRNVLSYLLENYQNKKIPKIIRKNLLKFFDLTYSDLQVKFNDVKKFKKRKNDIEDLSPLKFLNDNVKIPPSLSFYNPTLNKNKIRIKESLKNHIFLRDLPYILRTEDRISMGNSIENRTPFVSHDFIEYVFSHKSTFFCKDATPKYMLRKIMRKKLPKIFLNGKKVGRPINLSFFLKNFYFREFKKLILKNEIKFFDIKKIYNQFNLDLIERNNENSSFYFKVLNYLIWKRMFKL